MGCYEVRGKERRERGRGIEGKGGAGSSGSVGRSVGNGPMLWFRGGESGVRGVRSFV